MSDAANDALDLARIQETAEGDREFEQELLTVYLEDCDERMARLKQCIAKGDQPNTKIEAHCCPRQSGFEA